MFVEPEVTESKVTAKADPSAPARSAIRRQRTVRYTPHTRDHPSRALNDALSRDIQQQARRLPRYASRQRGAHQWATAGDRERRERDRYAAAEREAFRADRERHTASQRQRMENGRALLRDALSYERPGRMIIQQSSDDDMPDLAPMTDSNRPSYSDIVQRPQGVGSDGLTAEERRLVERVRERPPPARSMPTPPYSFEDSTTADHLAVLESMPPYGSAEYTARFAPARNQDLAEFHRQEADVSAQIRDLEARLGSQASTSTNTSTRAILDEVENARRETLHSLEEADRTIAAADRALSELPPLRRMGRRSHLPSPPENRSGTPRTRPAVDGLGDRSRSFSPEDDAWETLLNTMTPDERVPSVNSSFTSATASASASSSLAANSATNSYGTLATTAPSSNTSSTADIYATMCDDSDSSSDDSLWEERRRLGLSSPRNPHPRPVYSRRYNTRDRAEQLVDQVNRISELTPSEQEGANQIFREARARAMERLRARREAELHRIQADLDDLNRQAAAGWPEDDLVVQSRAVRERL